MMLPGREVGRWLFEVFVVLLSLHLSCASSDSKCLLGLDGHRYTGCNSHSRRSRQRNSLPVHSLYLSLSYNYYVCVCLCVCDTSHCTFSQLQLARHTLPTFIFYLRHLLVANKSTRLCRNAHVDNAWSQTLSTLTITKHSKRFHH